MTVIAFQKKYQLTFHRLDISPVREFLTGRVLCYTHNIDVRHGKQRFKMTVTTRMPELRDGQILGRLLALAGMMTEIENGQFFFREDTRVMRTDRYMAEGEYLFSLYLLVGVEGYQDFLSMATTEEPEEK